MKEKKTALGFDKIIKPHINELNGIAKRYGINYFFLFGSIARGEGNEHSDVDFLVDFIKIPTLFKLADLQLDLEKILKRNVDLVVRGCLKPEIEEAFCKEAKKVL